MLRASPDRYFTIKEIEAETGIKGTSIATAIKRKGARFARRKRAGGVGKPAYEYALLKKPFLPAGMVFRNCEPNYLIRPEHEESVRILDDDSIPSTCILGGAKTGKSSLVHHLIYQIRTSGKSNQYTILHVDFEKLTNPRDIAEADLYMEVIRQVQSSLPAGNLFFSYANQDRERVAQIRNSFFNSKLYTYMPGASFKLSDPMDSISRSVIEKTDIFLFFLSKKYLNTIGNKALNAIRNNIDIEETGKRPKFIVVRIEATLDAKGFERIETIDLSEKSDDDLKFLLEERLITESKSDGDADLESIQEQPGFQAHWLFKSLIGHHLRNCPAQRLLMVVDGLDFIFEKVPSFEWADGFVRWLGELRNRMNEMPYDRIKLFVNFGLMSYNSMFSKPLHTQALVIRSQPFSNEEISTLLRLYRLTENPSDTATRLLHLFNGQPYLTHFAIERMAETGDGIELFTEIPFGSVREFQAYWKRLKTALSLAVRKRKRDLDILLAGFSDQNETDQKQAPLLIKYRQYLEFLGIAKMSMNQGEIVSQPSCEFYKEMLANERRRTDD